MQVSLIDTVLFQFPDKKYTVGDWINYQEKA